jgi:hypothetical protein
MTDDDNGVFVPPKETFTVKARVCFRDDIDAKARDIADAVSVDADGVLMFDGEDNSATELIAEAIAAALLVARNEALEEAAMAADAFARDLRSGGDAYSAGDVEAAATVIRALKDTTAG